MKRILLIAVLIALAHWVSGQVITNMPFQINSNNPIDTRMTIATLADTSTIAFPYEGLLVHVNDADMYRKYNGATWEIFDPGGGGGAVSSVNSQTGAVVLDADDIDDTSTTNKFTSAGDISKLAGVEAGATADQSDAEIEAAYNAQVGIVSQVDAEAGTSTTPERWTPERVAQAIVALSPASSTTNIKNLVDDFGAIGTDTLSDQAAFDAATDWARVTPGSKILIIPPGEFTATDSINLDMNNVWIIGDRETSIITVDIVNQGFGLYTGIFAVSGENIHISGLSITGRFEPPSWDYVASTDAAYTNRMSGVEFLLGSRNGSVTNCNIYKTTRHGILLQGYGHEVANCVIDSVNSYGISSGGLSPLVLDDEVGTSAHHWVHDCEIGYSDAKRAIEVNDASNNIEFERIKMNLHTTSAGGCVFIHTHSNPFERNFNISFDQMTFDTCGGASGITVLGALASDNSVLLMQDIQLKNSVFRRHGGNVNLINYLDNFLVDNVDFNSTTALIIGNSNTGAFERPKHITVRNSRIIPDTFAVKTAVPITITNTTDINFENVKINGWTNDAVVINTSDSIRIVNSEINCGGNAIYFETATSNISIEGGQLADNGERGVRGLSNVTNFKMIGTDVSGNGTEPFNTSSLSSEHYIRNCNGYQDSTEVATPWKRVTDKLYYNQGALVGIGTTAPTRDLQVNNTSTNAVIKITNSSSGAGITDGFDFNLNTTNARFTNYESGYMSFRTNGANEAMRIASDQKVGIGVTTITALLHLAAGTATNNTAPLKFTAGTNTTTAAAGQMEYDGTYWYVTPVSTRQTVATGSNTLTFTNKTATNLNLTAGTTTLAPLVFNSGTNLTTPLSGRMEYDGARWYGTIASGPTRQTFAFLSDVTGTVSSVGLSLPSIFSVSGSPVTTTGTLTGTLATQTANTVFAGPTSGGAATPTFRTLVGADVANIPLSSLSNVDASGAADLQILQFQAGTSTYDNVDLNAAAIPIADAGSKYTGTTVETALQEVGFTNWTPADGATLALTTKENMILVDGGIDATVSITLNEASITSGTRMYIKGISMTTLTLNSSTGNFMAAGATSGASTLVPTGTFETMLIFNGGTWYQMY